MLTQAHNHKGYKSALNKEYHFLEGCASEAHHEGDFDTLERIISRMKEIERRLKETP